MSIIDLFHPGTRSRSQGLDDEDASSLTMLCDIAQAVAAFAAVSLGVQLLAAMLGVS